MKINSDTINVLDACDVLYEEILSARETSLRNKKIEPRLEVLIKNLLENARSSLDYLANQISSESNCGGMRIAFPIYSKTKGKFQKFVQDKFPNLETKNTDLFNKIESIQYYNNPEKKEWMKDLTILVNSYKHEKLEQQEVIQDGGVAIIGNGLKIFARTIDMGKGGTIIDASGNILRGPQIITKDTKSIQNNNGLIVQTLEWDDLFFKELSKPALPVLIDIMNGIRNLIKIVEG